MENIDGFQVKKQLEFEDVDDGAFWMPAALFADLLVRREGISMLAGAGLISSRTGAGSRVRKLLCPCLYLQQSFG